MESIKYELKYCEGCGTLKLRSVTSGTNYCKICERLLARFRFPRVAVARNCPNHPSTAELKVLAGIPLCVIPAGRVS